MAKVAQAIGRDPAMTAKILRIANSAFYSQRRPSQNLRQALVIIGLNAALTLALSFSLVSSMRALRPAASTTALLAPGLLGRHRRPRFQRSSQDDQPKNFPGRAAAGHGVLASIVRRAISTARCPSRDARGLDRLRKSELGKDHAPYTAMLLRSWNLPERSAGRRSQSYAPDVPGRH